MRTIFTKPHNKLMLTALLSGLIFFLSSCEIDEDCPYEKEMYSTFVITARSPELKMIRLTSIDNVLEIDIPYSIASQLTGITVDEWEEGFLIITEPTDSADYSRYSIPEVYQKDNTRYYWIVEDVIVSKPEYLAYSARSENKIYMNYDEPGKGLTLRRENSRTNLASVIANTTIVQYEGFKGVIINWFKLPEWK